MIEMGILDPTKVTRAALQNAASVSGLIITTEAMVADQPDEGGAGAMPDMGGGMGGMGGMIKVGGMLEDEILDEEESEELLTILHKISGEKSEIGELAKTSKLPIDTPQPSVTFQEKSFLFTGTCAFGNRTKCTEATRTLGGKVAKGVSKKLDYLVLGTYVTDSWAHETFGRKIETAMRYRDDGLPLVIITEEHWANEANDQKLEDKMNNRIFKSFKEKNREKLSYDEKWNSEDKGLITCWEVGKNKRLADSELAIKAENNELPVLGWKGGVDKELKNKKKFGSLNYLAQWQGLRGEDLDIDISQELRKFTRKLNAETTGDISRCDIQVKDPKIKECPPPKTFSGGERPASHVVFLMDASGSMAGKLAGKSKMSIAKKESLRFLNALQKDVPVGVVVYGHKGNNTKKGKAESCGSVEWVNKLGSGKAKLQKSVNALRPVGWTPLGDALDYTLAELKKIRKSKKDKESVPIVYLLSDGKETCGGDPVASAKALHKSGVKAIVNVIGFDVGKETREQLKAISEAGGGKYFPAKDAKALRKQLNAARDTELSLAHYERCRLFNLSHVVGVHNNALHDAVVCFSREVKRNIYEPIRKNLKAMVASGEISKQCADKAGLIAFRADVKAGKWLTETNKRIRAHQEVELEKIDAGSIWSAFKKN
ncbi:hypothetical protein GQR58_003377 [Nymphon striatum]|nr:hypothetical protein GQR58_003377 [Nymphon striatum]